MKLEVTEAGRLDKLIATALDGVSRSRVSELIDAGQVQINGVVCTKGSQRVAAGSVVTLGEIPEREAPDLTPVPMELEVVYEDDHLLVVNKPRDLSVHPSPGSKRPTLVHGLLARAHALAQGSAPHRPGLVHRLDKDTTGLILIAKNDRAHAHLAEQIQTRSAGRRYLAIARGWPPHERFTVDAPLAKDPKRPLARAVHPDGKPAISHVKRLIRLDEGALLAVKLETGRTHQIRVHMSHIKLPLVGDPDYGGRLRLPKGASAELVEALRGFRRQALHATRLELEHPASGELMAWEVPVPEDMQALLELLREDSRLHPDNG